MHTAAEGTCGTLKGGGGGGGGGGEGEILLKGVEHHLIVLPVQFTTN